MEFVTHVTRLIELVIDFRNVPDDDYNKDNRMGCMFNLLVSGAGQGGVGWGGEEWRGCEGRGEKCNGTYILLMYDASRSETPEPAGEGVRM